MALLSDELSVWEIAFRWEGVDPGLPWWRWCIPLLVRDRLRTLIHEIHHGHLDCSTMAIRKWRSEDGDELKKFFIRHWLTEVEECSYGRRFDREMLKWAHIDRGAMQEWCERHGVPLPEFWFPPGWKLEYEWPDEDDESDSAGQAASHPTDEKKRLIDDDHRAKMACQQIALYLWSKESTPSSIKAMAQRPEVLELGGGTGYEFETVADWLGQVDPRDPSKKRGRKRKNNSGGADSGEA